jgi:two-component system, NtrC family, sensor kinase
VFVNAAFTNLTGYSAEEAVGRNCRFLQGIDTDPVVVTEIRNALSTGTSIRREILNYRKDGEPFWNDLMIDPVLDDAGTLVGFVGVQYSGRNCPRSA